MITSQETLEVWLTIRCNLKLKEPTFDANDCVHNSSKYDFQLFIKELSEIDDPNLTVEYLPMNSETIHFLLCKI